MTQRPAVTVSIPVFNGADTIVEAIESVLSQSHADLEVVVIDNCSTDGTLEAVASIADPRLRVEKNPENIGMMGNLNRALEVAQGRFLKILCADDYLYPGCLERQVAALSEPGVGMVCCRRDIVDVGGRRLMTRGFPGPERRVSGLEAARLCLKRGTNLIGEPGAVLMTRELTAAVGRFRSDYPYAIDIDYWIRALAQSDLAVLAEPLCVLRVHSNSASVAMIGQQYRDVANLLDDWGQRPELGLGRASRWLGKTRALTNAGLRWMFYKCLVR